MSKDSSSERMESGIEQAAVAVVSERNRGMSVPRYFYNRAAQGEGRKRLVIHPPADRARWGEEGATG